MAKPAALIDLAEHRGDARLGQTVLGRYELVRRIADGGMGTVYEAVNRGIGRRFAVKFLRPDLQDDPKTLARFQQEAVAAGALEHENICAIVDHGEARDGEPCLIMEFLEGDNLAELLADEGPLAVPRAVEIVRQICRGLAAAHGAGVVHRDLKPKNLILCRHADGRDWVKIVDFGIAKLRGPDVAQGHSTTTGATLGTPHYMPPEQARGEKNLDARADIYALGVILYELLTGEHPHPGDSYNAIIYHILSQEPVPLREHRPEVPEGLARIVEQAMASEPKDRFADAQQLERALAPFGVAGRSVRAASDDTAGSREAPALRPAPPRTRIAVAFAVGAALAGAVTWLALPHHPTPAVAAEPSATTSQSASPAAPKPEPSAVEPAASSHAEPSATVPPAAIAPSARPSSPPPVAEARPTSKRTTPSPPKPAGPASAAPKSSGTFDWSNPYQ